MTEAPDVFAIMPFGVRRANEAHKCTHISFDDVYRGVIESAAAMAGLTAIRADRVGTPRCASTKCIELLFESRFAVADVSVPNANVYYELGVRYSIATGRTALIAAVGTRLPFALKGRKVIRYSLSQKGFASAARKLAAWLMEPMPETSDSPVRCFLESIGAGTPLSDPVAVEQELLLRIDQAASASPLVALWKSVRHISSIPPLSLMSLAARLGTFGEWALSVEVLRQATSDAPDDARLLRQLAWHLRHLDPHHQDEAEAVLRRVLHQDPQDAEALGMLGGIYKRRGDFGQSLECYSHAARVSPYSLYSLVNRAAMQTLLSCKAGKVDASEYASVLKVLSTQPSASVDEWSHLVEAECRFALADDSGARESFGKAFDVSASRDNVASCIEQIELLARHGFRPDAASPLSEWARDLFDLTLEGGERKRKDPRVNSPDTPVVVHLSDVHFGRNTAGEEMHRFESAPYNDSLITHLKREFSATKPHFRDSEHRVVLVVSGDLAYAATEDEFDKVVTFLNASVEALKIPKERVVLCPGNHDVFWKDAEINKAHRFDNYLGMLVTFYGDPLFRKLYPRIKWDMKLRSKRPDPIDIIGLHNLSEMGVAFVSLNSCVYETNQHHYGFIGGNQLRAADELVEQAGLLPSQVVVAVMHHHLHPFPDSVGLRESDSPIWTDLSTVRDAGLVEKRLEKMGVDVVLHGHKHSPQVRETVIKAQGIRVKQPNRLIVCGSGSTGVAKAELAHNVGNHYEVIEFLRLPRVRYTNFLSIEWRDLAVSAEAEWTTTAEWTVEG